MRCFAVLLIMTISIGAGATTESYLRVIQEQGVEPVPFVRNALKSHDLIIFDDALHNAKEPFDFYARLLQDPSIQNRIKFVFFEVLSITAQPALDAYINGKNADPTLLLKVFQDDYSGYGWRYQTYLDLLNTIRDINSKLPPTERIQVVGVDQPIYWEAIHTRNDYDLFQDSLMARDYFLFQAILKKMDYFQSGKKGLFLTNTRHAYKHLRKRNGQLHWNTATFFDQFYPGKSFSIRFHNATLFVEAMQKAEAGNSTEGLEEATFKWVRMENGVWDQAFKETKNQPVAIPLSGNVFGKASYIGNLMLDAREDQTMADVYDAIVFLKPLDELQISGKFNFIYTQDFRKELKRRIGILEGDHLDSFLKENGATSMDEFIDMIAQPADVKKNPLVDTASE